MTLNLYFLYAMTQIKSYIFQAMRLTLYLLKYKDNVLCIEMVPGAYCTQKA